MKIDFLKIKSCFLFPTGSRETQSYISSMEQVIKKMIPPYLSYEFYFQKLAASSPIINWSVSKKNPYTLSMSILSLANHSHGIESFFSDKIMRNLIPGKELPITLTRSLNFCFMIQPEQPYFVAEIHMTLENETHLQNIQSSLPLLSEKIRLTALATMHARKIICKNPSYYPTKHIPHQNTFQEIESLIDLFGQKRASKCYTNHTYRIFSYLYLLRKKIQTQESKPIIFIKPFEAEPQSKASILTILIACNQTKIDEKDLIECLQSNVPDSSLIEGSFIHLKDSNDISTIHMQMAQKKGHTFTQTEIRNLKSVLEKTMLNLSQSYYTQHEEELMHDILLLSKKLKGSQDCLQPNLQISHESTSKITFKILSEILDEELFLTLSSRFSQLIEKIKHKIALLISDSTPLTMTNISIGGTQILGLIFSAQDRTLRETFLSQVVSLVKSLDPQLSLSL